MASLNEDSFPNIKAMLKPREAKGSKMFLHQRHISAGQLVPEKPESEHAFLPKGPFFIPGPCLLDKLTFQE